MNTSATNPIFVLGNPRSGTTLLRLMLTCHPRITIPPECGFALWLRRRWGGWTERHSADQGEVRRFVEDVLTTRKFETWGVTGDDLVAAVARERPTSYAALVAAVYGAYLWRRGRAGGRWGDKNNYYVEHVPELRSLFPRCSLVHIVRDGRDVACSYVELAKRVITSTYAPRLPAALDDIADAWVRNVTNVRTAFDDEGWRDVVEVRYEDLVARPEETLIALLRALDETFDPKMLDYAARNAEEELEPKEFLQWKGRTLHAPNTEGVGRYARDLSRAQVATLEARMGPLLERYGYPLSAPSP